MARKPKLHGITFNEKVGQLSYYPPEELLQTLSKVSQNRPRYENNAKVRAKKEAIYNRFLSQTKLDRFFTGNISYCGLTSVFFDRIFLLAYPLICRAFVYENDPIMIGRVKDQLDYMLKAGMSDFVDSIGFVPSTIFDLESHKQNRYGWIDLDFNQTTTYENCRNIDDLVRRCADNRCLVSIWNAVGMKHLNADEQRGMTSELIDSWRSDFDVCSDEEIVYEDTALMYVRIIKLQRRSE